MTTAATISARLILSKDEYDQGLKDAGSAASSFASKMKAIGGQMSSIGGTIIKGAFIGAAAGIAALGVELNNDIQAAMESEKVQSQLNAVLKSTGGIAGVTAKQVNDLANAMSMKTGIDDENLITAQNMLLTFTDIGKNVFPDTIQAVADMATAMNGGAIPSAEAMQNQAIQLGKALQDPDKGLGALARVGVNVDDLRKKFTPLMTKEEKQILILQELQTEFGGSAEAAGKTFAGQLSILQIKLGNIRESIGAKLMPVLGDLASMFSEQINRPEVQAFIENFSNAIVRFAKTAIEKIPLVISSIKKAFNWLINNKGVIVAVFAVLGSVIAAWAVTTIISMAPIILALALIGGAAYLLYTAWTQNWGGIQQKVQYALAYIQPKFQELQTWLKENLPKAMLVLKGFWENKLIPAFQTGIKKFSDLKGVFKVVVDVVKKVIDAFKNAPPGVQKLILTIATLALTALVLKQAFGTTAATTPSFIGQIVGVAGSFMKLLGVAAMVVKILMFFGVSVGPVGAAIVGLSGALGAAVSFLLPIIAIILLIVGAVVLLYFAWKNNWFGIRDITAEVLAWIGGVVDEAMQWYSDLTSGKLGELSNIWNTTFGTIKANLSLALANLRLLFQAFQAAWHGDWTKVGQLMRQVWDNALTGIKNAFSAAGKNISSIFKGIGNTLRTAWNGIDWSGMGTSLVQSIASGIQNALPNLLSAAGNILNALKNFFTGFFGGGGGGTTGGGTTTGGGGGGVGNKKAIGGPVMAGQTHVVGERGMELFTPSTNGVIIPNNQLGMQQGTINYYNPTITIITGKTDPRKSLRGLT